MKLLVYYESYPDVRDAIQREKNIKKWPRRWKLDLIRSMNPDWHDLMRTLRDVGGRDGLPGQARQ